MHERITPKNEKKNMRLLSRSALLFTVRGKAITRKLQIFTIAPSRSNARNVRTREHLPGSMAKAMKVTLVLLLVIISSVAAREPIRVARGLNGPILTENYKSLVWEDLAKGVLPINGADVVIAGYIFPNSFMLGSAEVPAIYQERPGEGLMVELPATYLNALKDYPRGRKHRFYGAFLKRDGTGPARYELIRLDAVEAADAGAPPKKSASGPGKVETAPITK
jgi:hypothetical protein